MLYKIDRHHTINVCGVVCLSPHIQSAHLHINTLNVIYHMSLEVMLSDFGNLFETFWISFGDLSDTFKWFAGYHLSLFLKSSCRLLEIVGTFWWTFRHLLDIFWIAFEIYIGPRLSTHSHISGSKASSKAGSGGRSMYLIKKLSSSKWVIIWDLLCIARMFPLNL